MHVKGRGKCTRSYEVAIVKTCGNLLSGKLIFSASSKRWSENQFLLIEIEESGISNFLPLKQQHGQDCQVVEHSASLGMQNKDRIEERYKSEADAEGKA